MEIENKLIQQYTVHNRDGFEDTTFDAKAKDSKKNARQRPKTNFSKTDPLEAKDRNVRDQVQGPRAQFC